MLGSPYCFSLLIPGFSDCQSESTLVLAAFTCRLLLLRLRLSRFLFHQRIKIFLFLICNPQSAVRCKGILQVFLVHSLLVIFPGNLTRYYSSEEPQLPVCAPGIMSIGLFPPHRSQNSKLLHTKDPIETPRSSVRVR